jgi:sulfotransferase family protein
MGNPFLFIVGCPRSGTTLLQRVINAHPQIAITPESHWIPHLYEKPWALAPGGVIEHKLVRELGKHPKFARLGISREELKKLERSSRNGHPLTYSRFVTAIFNLYGQVQRKPLVGDKTPDYVRRIRVLHELWPEARFVHVIRDGREVCLSMREWSKVHPKPGDFTTWKDDPVSTVAWWWERNVRLGRDAGGLLGSGLYHELRYESLVARPREECERLCAFLGLPFDEAMLRFHEDRARPDPGLEPKRAGLPVTAGLRDWQSQMPAEQVEQFEAAADEVLNELGYPRTVRRPRPEALDRAARVRRLLAEDPRTHD